VTNGTTALPNWARDLGLQPHPEGGWYAETYRSSLQAPHGLVPAGHWQAARPVEDAAVLVSCVVSPGFDFDDFTLLEE